MAGVRTTYNQTNARCNEILSASNAGIKPMHRPRLVRSLIFIASWPPSLETMQHEQLECTCRPTSMALTSDLLPWNPIMLVMSCSDRKDIYDVHATPSRSRRTLIVRMLENLNLLCLIAGGRSKYIPTNVRCNETLPGFKQLTAKDQNLSFQTM